MDEFKLSVDVEANLSRLDVSLNNAIQKARVAGQRMQAELTGGGGSGYAGVSTLVIQNTASGHVSGMSAVFGGGLNAIGGNQSTLTQLNMASAHNAAMTRQQQIESILGPRGGMFSGAEAVLQRFGISAISPMSIGVGAATVGMPLLNRGIELDMQRLRNVNSAQIQRAVMTTGPYGGPEAIRQLDYQYQNVQIPGALGMVPGANSLLRNAIGWMYNKRYGQPLNLQGLANAAEERVGFQRQAAMGSYGGFISEREGLNFDIQQSYTRRAVLEQQQGKQFADAWAASQNAVFNQQAQKIARDRQSDMMTLKAQAQQSQLNAFGAATLGNVVGIRNSFAVQRLQTDYRDTARLEALGRAESAAVLEAFSSGTQQATAFAPGMAALGTDRVAGIRGQDRETLRILSNIDRNLGADLVQAAVGHN